MKRVIVASMIVAGLFGCSERKAIEPVTTVLSADIMGVLKHQCPKAYSPTHTAGSHGVDIIVRDAFLCEEFLHARAFHAYVETSGRGPSQKCAVRIGPATLTGPIASFDFIRPWFADPDVADHVLAAIGKPDTTRMFTLDVFVDGFTVRVRLDQWFDMPTVFLEVDGCEQLGGRVVEHRLERRDDESEIFIPADERAARRERRRLLEQLRRDAPANDAGEARAP